MLSLYFLFVCLFVLFFRGEGVQWNTSWHIPVMLNNHRTPYNNTSNFDRYSVYTRVNMTLSILVRPFRWLASKDCWISCLSIFWHWAYPMMFFSQKRDVCPKLDLYLIIRSVYTLMHC
jgi:hypothetical protein